MKQFIKTIFLIVLMSMVGGNICAQTTYLDTNYDFYVDNADGVTIYYGYTDDMKELCVKTPKRGYYTGVINIPEEVTYMNRTKKVTSIGKGAFMDCQGLTSVLLPPSITKIEASAFAYTSLTSINFPNNLKGIGATAFLKSELSNIILPNNLVTIGDHAFENCKLKILTLPNSLNIIGEHAFYGIDFPAVVSLIEKPFSIYSVFSNNTLANATLYVPIGTIDKYKETYGWKKFLFIEEGNGPNGGDTPETKKCATPTIGYKNGKLTFNCATEDAVCHSTITNTDITSYSSNEVQLGVTYNISVYATKAGYENSETVTATLCWIDVDPKTEGITNNVAQVRSNAVIIQSSNGVVSVSGMDDGTNVAVYSTSGQMAAYAIASDNRALLSTHLIKGEIAIVKIGEKSVKVVMR